MRKLVSRLLFGICSMVMCFNFFACHDSENNYQVSKEEYEAAFTMEAFANVSVTITGPYWERDHKKEYFYGVGENYALCKYSNDRQYYGRYYGVMGGVMSGVEFAYTYGNESLEDFTEQQGVWEKSNNPSYYKTKGANEFLSYKREFNFLEYDNETKSYQYENTAYGDKIVYSYYFVNKKLIRYEVDMEKDDYHYVCEFYNYGTTVIPVEIEGVIPNQQGGHFQLFSILQSLPYGSNVEWLIDKYNFDEKDYHLIDNADDYCEFLSEIGVPYEGPFDDLFSGNVMLCYFRCVSGSADFIPVEYSYNLNKNAIECKTTYQPEPGSAYPDVIICYCVDLVEVPRAIFNKLNPS